MDDTTREVYALQVKLWRSKSFEQRMRLACANDKMGLEAAAKIARQSYPDDPAGLFLVLHGDKMGSRERTRIAQAFRKRSMNRAHGEIEPQDDEFVREAARRALDRNEW